VICIELAEVVAAQGRTDEARALRHRAEVAGVAPPGDGPRDVSATLEALASLRQGRDAGQRPAGGSGPDPKRPD
jgi:hypothetical protein